MMNAIITRTSCPVCESVNISKVLECRDHTVSQQVFGIWQCGECALRFTQDVPGQEFIGPYYCSDTYISHTDTDKGLVNKLYKIAQSYTLRWKMKLVTKYSGTQGIPGTLLDIGAGTGAFLNHAAGAKWSVFGLEPDEGARRVSLAKYGLQLESAQKLFELPSRQFDVITMWHVLEHVHDLQAYLAEIRRVLKEDGVALIALPNYTSRDAALYGADWAAYDVPRHLYHFAPRPLKTLVAKHGMQVDMIQPMWLDAFYIAMLSEQYKNVKGNIFKAVLNGFRSNWNALPAKKRENCSSLVYVIRKRRREGFDDRANLKS